MSALNDIIKKTIKKTPNLIRNSIEAGTPKFIQLDSPQLNYALGGKFCIGKIYNFLGPWSGGKSSIACYIAGQLQKKMPENQQVVVYIDFERSFNTLHAQQIGMNCDDFSDGGKLIYMAPDTIEDASDNLIDIIKSHEIALVIMDSESAAPTRIQLTDPAGKANFGSAAKALGEFLKKFNVLCANNETSMIVISQERANLTPMSHLPAQTGGYALPYYSSYRARITKRDVIQEGDETIGQEIRFRCYKSKIGIPFRTGETKLYYGNGKSGIKGFNSNEEYIDFLIKLDIIKQGGAWFSSEEFGFKLQGREKVQLWLDEHKDEYERLKKQVDETLTKESILDANRVMGDEEINESIDEEISDDILNDDE